MKINKNLSQFIKYCLVGVLGTGLDFLILFLLVEYGHLFYLWAAIISVIIVVTISFTLNKFWSFQKKDGRYLPQLLQYALVNAIGVGIGLAILSFLVEILDIWYILAKVWATIASLIWNFIVTKKWIFKS